MSVEVLLVDDSPSDVRLTQEAFLDANESVHLHVASDGVEAMAFLRHEGAYLHAPRPALILLDLNLPKMDGREVLAHIKKDASLKTIPTVILTTSEAEADIVKSYQLHANCYLCKLAQLDAFESLVKRLELTESVLMQHAESAASVLKSLRAKGVQISVDDFGTGYSSLSYLQKFPIDALKIDQSFVRQITSTPYDTNIVTAIISMARSLKLRVVAEGVESQEELRFLQAHQSDEAQGYYFSRPIVAQQLAKLLETGIGETVQH